MEREIALDILISYYRDNGYLNILLNNKFNNTNLTKEKKNFITRVVYGTVQYQIYLTYLIEPFIKKRLKVYERMLLLMSMYQKEFMDSIPDYAIVNTSVEMAKKKKGIKTANFINAVLKNAFSNKRSLNDLKDNERLSIETSHPLWLVNMFIKQYGYETTVKICHSNNEIPKQTGRVNTLKTSIEDVLKNPLYTKSILSKDGVYYSGGNIANSEEFQKGYVTVQDESSQLVAYLLKPYGKVLDMCSAPGSKTTHLAAYMENKGSIDAYDLYEHKINLIHQNIERLGVKNVHTHCYDSTLLNTIYDKESFDCILLDAPCSGLGDLRRKPEIRYHDSSIMDELIPLQKKLLENAYDLLAKGGRIVYSTCTINKKENEKQIENFLSNHPDLIKKEEQTILPYEYGSDGFYMCLIEKE
jgi:16S rRNA (cytosine967-C5)-methyltransferase